ncbi:DUF1697 domain-containing protein [Bacteroidota bacterium]
MERTMQTFIALLRGINVSGQKRILMQDLRDLMGELNLESITTYIQSGNIVFRSSFENPREIEQIIEEKILEKYGFEVPVLVKFPEELNHIHNHNPFIAKYREEENQFLTVFLYDKPSPDLVAELNKLDYPGEQFKVEGDCIYLYNTIGFGKAKLKINLIEKKLKVKATARNWKTVSSLHELAIAL